MEPGRFFFSCLGFVLFWGAWGVVFVFVLFCFMAHLDVHPEVTGVSI